MVDILTSFVFIFLNRAKFRPSRSHWSQDNLRGIYTKHKLCHKSQISRALSYDTKFTSYDKKNSRRTTKKIHVARQKLFVSCKQVCYVLRERILDEFCRTRTKVRINKIAITKQIASVSSGIWWKIEQGQKFCPTLPYPTFVRCLSDYCLTIVWNSSYFCPTIVRSIVHLLPNYCPTIVRLSSAICPTFVWNLADYCQKLVQLLSNFCPIAHDPTFLCRKHSAKWSKRTANIGFKHRKT
jgi:hypothetical protein